MNKDIIYIDTEDDITAIIGKIKASKEKIVALVPPKRTGVLQSAVNLRLLSRTAEKNNKNLVLVTNNKSLIALSATAKIPYAKNLQSKPEIAEIAALEIDDGEDIIDGSQLPIGELAKTADKKPIDDVADDLSAIDIDDEGPKNISTTSKGSSKKPKNNVKVPNFSRFRKKLFLIITGGILLVIFLIWAIWFAPSAKIIITAKTDPAPVSGNVILGGTATSDVNKNIIQSITQQTKKDVSVDFTATGTKDMGDKATGTIKVENCDSPDSFSISSGTIFVSNSGKNFVNSSQVTVPGLTGSAAVCRATRAGAGTVNVAVTAQQSGTDYNIAAMDYSISNISGDVYAHGSVMTGGSSRIATIVNADDVQKASQALVDLPSNDVKKQLTSQFTSGNLIITDSFTVDRAAAVSVPAIGAEATSGKAKLTSATTYSMTAIAKAELEPFLKAAINKQISDSKTQIINNNGIDKVKLSGYLKTDQGATVNYSTTGQIGPKIDKEAIKNEAKGKHYGDVQSQLEAIKGVDSVDIKFSYFWVNTVPNDANKIQVEFVISNA